MLLLATALALAGPFGRFGYQALPVAPGFRIDHSGFVANSPSADRFGFGRTIPRYITVGVDDVELEARLEGGGGKTPTKLRVNLLTPGIALGFDAKPQFSLTSTRAPLLTWESGSAGDGVPTPPSKWLIVTFQEAQPPVLLKTDAEMSWMVSGTPGAWTLAASEPLRGWLRVALPLGTRAIVANTASSLGEVLKQSQPIVNLLEGPPPKLVERRVAEVELGVIVSWKFDRPGAIVPPSAILAPQAGYALRIESPVARTSITTEDGPVAVCTTDTLRIRFPCLKIPTGRAVTLGAAPPAISTASAYDPSSLAELSLNLLLASADGVQLQVAQAASDEFLAEADYPSEPISRQPMPIALDGSNLGLLAAHALSGQALATGAAIPERSALLESLAWARDWPTWRFKVGDEAQAATAASFAAVAGLMGDEHARADAALLQAGLAAQSVLRGRVPLPFEELRATLYRYAGAEDNDLYARSLFSPLRAVSSLGVTAAKSQEGRVRLSWSVPDSRPREIALLGAVGEIQSFEKARLASPAGASPIRIRTTGEGPGWVELKPTTELPESAAPPRVDPPNLG